jgi:hypothetical protein
MYIYTYIYVYIHICIYKNYVCMNIKCTFESRVGPNSRYMSHPFIRENDSNNWLDTYGVSIHDCP